MERLLQYLDDLDDLFGMAGLLLERARRVLRVVFSYLMLCTGALAGVSLALLHPPVAMATAVLLFVTQMYRSITTRPLSDAQPRQA